MVLTLMELLVSHDILLAPMYGVLRKLSVFALAAILAVVADSFLPNAA